MILNKEKISIRSIQEADMNFITQLWGDEETMFTSGGVYKVDDSNRDALFEILNKGEEINNHYIILNDDIPVGDLSIRKFDEKKSASLDMKILHAERNKSYAKGAFTLILDHLFNHIEAEEVALEIWLVNSFAQQKLKDYDFEATLVMEDATIMTLTKENYLKGELHV